MYIKIRGNKDFSFFHEFFITYLVRMGIYFEVIVGTLLMMMMVMMHMRMF